MGALRQKMIEEIRLRNFSPRTEQAYVSAPELPKKSAHDLLLELSGIDLSRCPRCQKGTMIVIGELPKVLQWDSS